MIIAWLRGYEPLVEQVAALLEQHSELFWTPVSIAEIFAGVRKGEEVAVQNLFLLLETVEITMPTGKKAGQYLKSFMKSHGVQLGDALIAASASIETLELWTLNRKHYPMRDIRFFTSRTPSN